MFSLLGLTPLLLLALTTGTQAYCPQLHPHETCFELYTSFEKALLESRQNLYNLREEYFPSSHSPSIYGHVNYTLIVSNLDESKPHCKSYHTEVPVSVNKLNNTQHKFIWSASGLLITLEPFILSFYQLDILSALFGTVGILDFRFYPYPPQPSYIVLNLTLVFDSLPCIPSQGQIDITLQDLTSWLKVYAKAQGNVTQPWDVQDKGYGIPVRDVSKGTVYYILYANFLFLSALVTVVLWGISPTGYHELVKKNDWTSQAFFWGAAVVAFWCNVATITTELFIHINYWVFRRQWSKVRIWSEIYGGTKHAEILFFLVADLAVAWCIICKHREHTRFPVPRLLKVLADNCCSRWCGNTECTAKLLQIMAMWNLLVFIHFVAIGSIPIIIWIMVLPIHMLSVIFLICMALLMMVFFLGTLFSIFPLVLPHNTPQLEQGLQAGHMADENSSTCRKSLILQLLIIPLLVVTIALLVTIYLDLVATHINTNAPTAILTSFFPTALLTVVGWFVTTKARSLLASARETSDIRVNQPDDA